MRRGELLVLAVLGLAGACDPGPQAGDIVFDLATPNQNDGAVQFVVTASETETIAGVAAACAGCQIFSAVVSETEVRGVIVGDIGAGALITVTVPDVRADTYTVIVTAAAAPDFSLRAVDGYALTRND